MSLFTNYTNSKGINQFIPAFTILQQMIWSSALIPLLFAVWEVFASIHRVLPIWITILSKPCGIFNANRENWKEEPSKNVVCSWSESKASHWKSQRLQSYALQTEFSNVFSPFFGGTNLIDHKNEMPQGSWYPIRCQNTKNKWCRRSLWPCLKFG